MNFRCLVFAVITMLFFGKEQYLYSQEFSVSEATISIFTKDQGELRRTIKVLQEEVFKRTEIHVPIHRVNLSANSLTIILGLEKDVEQLSLQDRELIQKMPSIENEGFKFLVHPERKTIFIIGHDSRGLLYGVGYFLRKTEMRPSKITLSTLLNRSSSPKYAVRGHQLGYRPKTNSYDAFTVAQFDQYIRELAIFGANTIEILPPITDDEFSSPHMKLTAAEMIVEQSRICEEYGLDVSMWFPNIGTDYLHPDSIREELDYRESVFSSLPKLNALFVPAGDPGDLEPKVLFTWLEQVARLLKKHHPNAKIWLSPQFFNPTDEWFTTFFDYINREYEWLGGVVFGPWINMPIQEIRNRLNSSIPIRRYPDITHNYSCQYPIHDWDSAWALTLGRESITPRPYSMKKTHNALHSYGIGSITYSEGTNDDINKFIWTGQDWDPETKVIETLRDYTRFFIGADHTEAAALGFIDLENNLKGPLLTNQRILQTLRRWQHIEQHVPLSIRQNPRFQMGLIRAYFDAYTYRRLLYETEIEQQVRYLLEQAKGDSLTKNIQEALNILQRTQQQTVAQDWKEKCIALADSLFSSIGAQLTVEKHGGREERGNFIDHIDMPLTDSPWLLAQLKEIERLPHRVEKEKRIYSLLYRTDPGPGGYYDHYGTMASTDRIVINSSLWDDPGSLRSPREGFNIKVLNASQREATPLAWLKQVETLYDQPLQICYKDLDTKGNYKIRIAYTGRFKSHVKLVTDDDFVIHDYLLLGQQPVYEFQVPASSTADGQITFTWSCKVGERGLQVAEIWLIKE